MKIKILYHEVLEKQGVVSVVAHERLTDARVTIEWLLAKPSSLSDLPTFLGPDGIKIECDRMIISYIQFTITYYLN